MNNAEKVRVQGLEADLTARLTDDLTLDLSATYAEATYERYTQGSCYTGRTPDDPLTGACDLSGQGLPFAPKLTATAGVQWQHSFGADVPVLAPRRQLGRRAQRDLGAQSELRRAGRLRPHELPSRL